MYNQWIITAPIDHKQERLYAFQVLLGDWLGLSFEVVWSDVEAVSLRYGEKEMHIPDHFFQGLPDPVDWAQVIKPNSFLWLEADDLFEAIPVFYGESWVKERSVEHIRLGCDLFAEVFFYLTRWEETQIMDLDRFGRINEQELLAVRHALHYYPVLDMLLHRLKALMESFFKVMIEEQHPFKVKVTHDVDHLRRFDTPKKWISAMGGDLLLRKKPWLIFKTTWEYISINLGWRKDNYDRFEELMDISEKYGLKSHFYFIPSHNGEEDLRYDIRSKTAIETIDRILQRGHLIGVHGSFASAWDEQVFVKELLRLRTHIPTIDQGRMHYLRYKNPHTWRMWDHAGLKRESSLGLSSDIGFRCGTARPFHVFDLEKRVQLSLIEEPLILMEVALIRRYPSADDGLKASEHIVNFCKKYGGQFVYLWHPENLDHPYWGQYAHLYEAILSYAVKGKN